MHFDIVDVVATCWGLKWGSEWGRKGFKVTLNVVWLPIAADLLGFSHCHNHLWGLQRIVGGGRKYPVSVINWFVCVRGLRSLIPTGWRPWKGNILSSVTKFNKRLWSNETAALSASLHPESNKWSDTTWWNVPQGELFPCVLFHLQNELLKSVACLIWTFWQICLRAEKHWSK